METTLWAVIDWATPEEPEPGLEGGVIHIDEAIAPQLATAIRGVSWPGRCAASS